MSGRELKEAKASAQKWRDECVVEARLHGAKLKRAEQAEAEVARLREALRQCGELASRPVIVEIVHAALRGEEKTDG